MFTSKIINMMWSISGGSEAVNILHINIEDCGGVSGYYELLEALRDPHHDDHERLRTWVGAHFDPELFSVPQLNSAFAVE